MQADSSKPMKDTFTLERAEEDDEFEEFERDGPFLRYWMTNRLHWEDNWDTMNENDDFCTQLRAEFDKSKTQ